MRSNSFANVAISFPTQGAKYSNLFLDWTQCSTSLDLIVLSCIFQPDYFQGAKISNLFLDPSGHHLLISLKSSEAEAGPSLYYLHSKWQQPKSVQSLDFPNNFEGRFAHHSFTTQMICWSSSIFCRPCNKFKGTLVSAVGWAQGQVGFLDFSTQPLSIETKIKLNHCCKNKIVLEGRCKHGTLAGWDHFGFDHWGGAHQRWEVLLHGRRGGAF